MKYKFSEDKQIAQAKKHIDKTYGQHYGNGKYQATDVIIDAGYGEAFCMGNIMKYAMRYGKKNGKNKDDLMKIIHYTVIAMHLLDEEVRNG